MASAGRRFTFRHCRTTPRVR